MSGGFGPDDLLNLYRRGIFPMGEDADDTQLFIVDPDQRGIIPLDALHISKSLRKTVSKDEFRVTFDTAFTSVMEACAAPYENRESTWINTPIINLYSALHRQGYAHSVECWKDSELVGGLYGVSLGGAFFGESMFSTRSNASKVALVHLVARLLTGGYILLDTQFITEHLLSLGAIEIPRHEFQNKLAIALKANGDFYSDFGAIQSSSMDDFGIEIESINDPERSTGTASKSASSTNIGSGLKSSIEGNPIDADSLISDDGSASSGIASNPRLDSSYKSNGFASVPGKAALQLITQTS